MHFNSLFNEKNDFHTYICRVSEIEDFERILKGIFLKKESVHSGFCYVHFSDRVIGYCADAAFDMISVKKRAVETIALNHMFESFTMDVYRFIEEQQDNTLFVFDSLSELQAAWATDLMMVNFFKVIAQIIKKKNSTAFFSLIRSSHSESTCNDIKDNADLFIDIFSNYSQLYVKVEKWGETHKAIRPYIFDDKSGSFEVIKDPVLTSRFLQAVTDDREKKYYGNRDAWERFFEETRQKFQNGKNIDEDCQKMSRIMMSRDDRIRELLNRHFSPIDYFWVKEHMIGSGLIGGKACGMLIARKIVENISPDIYGRFEAQDSFFIGSDVYYSYIVNNNYWDLFVHQRTDEGYFELADEFAEKLKTGKFSKEQEKEFIRLLEYYGPCPIIVRSSSLLEDGFGNAFAGKYESVFCPNVNSIEERLEEFENAIRIVYASTLSKSALDYRYRRGLDKKDEQMSLLVMKVSGSFYGDYYLPCAAGVGYSYSTYRFLKDMDPAAGMLRLVMGLGTAAVDRIEGSYPRLVSLDKPEVTTFKNIAEAHRFSQKKLEVLNTKEAKIEQIDTEKIIGLMPYDKRKLLIQHDTEAERAFRERGIRRDISFVSCQGIVNNRQIISDIYKMMQIIQNEYGVPVDIEFTINPDSMGECLVNLLQCRPLKAFQKASHLKMPDASTDKIWLDSRHASMGISQRTKLDLIIYVDPMKYYLMPYNDKYQVAKCIGRVNWKLRGKNKKIVLLSPGRLGTSSPELGVPTVFADISEFSGVIEIAESRAGYNPELSFGSHMFQDLTENKILYGAILENKKDQIFDIGKIQKLPNVLPLYDEDAGELNEIIGIYDVSDHECVLYYDMIEERLLCTFSEKGDSLDE